ncbi:beta-galactosidase/beta-glucuronidase [Hyaloraphidium curvatum]|nr:beta-galactosidase/beta-glucuronidase [Hyaloraphidium curvatum]
MGCKDEGTMGLRGPDGPNALYIGYVREPEGNKLAFYRIGGPDESPASAPWCGSKHFVSLHLRQSTSWRCSKAPEPAPKTRVAVKERLCTLSVTEGRVAESHCGGSDILFSTQGDSGHPMERVSLASGSPHASPWRVSLAAEANPPGYPPPPAVPPDISLADVPVAVPGDVHSALLAAKLIPDPFWDRNELAVQWVGGREWAFETEFDASSLAGCAFVDLCLDKVDTFSTISVNGHVVGTTSSAFLSYRFPLRPSLLSFAPGARNALRIHLRSAEREAAHLASGLEFPLPTQMGNGTIKEHWNLVRKPACHAGWDWGIALMVCGVLGDVVLVGSDGRGEVESVVARQRWEGKGADVDLGRVELDVEVHALSRTGMEGGKLRLELRPHAASGPDEEAVVVEADDVSLPRGSGVIAATMAVEKPRLWWPNGLGAQHLYQLTATLYGADGHELSSQSTSLGLRSLEVVNERDALGASLFFRVNGVDVFCKGANWIPCSPLPSLMTKERYDLFLKGAAKANMNMIRLWGGGMYENPPFYDACDRLGLMVWHDLPFSCSTYPSSDDFVALVVPELRQNLRRLSSRACVALWCGDNECVGALTWFDETKAHRDLYVTNYDRLNRKVADVVREEWVPFFWPSSPCGGPSMADVWRDNWHADGFGDMHFWSVWHEQAPFSAFLGVHPRFCSEFGFQSIPSLDTIAAFCPPGEENPYSPSMEFHQKNEGGNGRIMGTMERYFRFPEGGIRTVVYLSQLQQAVAIKTAVEYWRTLRPACMGTVYWQLNDMWPVCSWSSVEWDGRWKMLHYFARSFYGDAVVVALPGHATKRRRDDEKRTDSRRGEETVEVWVVNDRVQPISVSINVELWDLRAGRLVSTSTLARTVPKLGSEMLASYLFSDFCGTEEHRQTRFLNLEMTYSDASGVVVNSGHRQASTYFFFVPYKHLSLPKSGPVVPQITTGEGSTFHVKITSPVILVHLYLAVEGADGEFEGANGDRMVFPGRETCLKFVPRRRLSLDEFRERLKVSHLRDTFA